MKGCSLWSYRPYMPLLYEVGEPYICRVAPRADAIDLEWLPLGEGEEYSVFVGGREAEMRLYCRTSACSCRIAGLAEDAEYRFQVRCGERASRVRLARTGSCPGTVVNYLHPEDTAYSYSGRYLCSPSLVRHPDGYLLASMDVYAPDAPQNLTLIYRSDDEGESWRYVSELFPCFWGKLFVHAGKLYMLACSTEYGDLIIGCSEDGGETFCTPTVLLRGSCHSKTPGIHKNPQPVLQYGHRLWNTLEWGCWSEGTHAPMVMSADVSADLLDSASWRFTPPVPYDPKWPGVAVGRSAGTIEGTLVVSPQGRLLNIMRYDMTACEPNHGRALVYAVDTDDPDAPLSYVGAIPFPGNHAKFEIKYCPNTKLYWSIADRILDDGAVQSRNLLSLLFSADLRTWRVARDIWDYRHSDPMYTGFQYVDFFFEGSDILLLCRTAFNHPHNYHNSNYSVFSRIKDYPSLCGRQHGQ